MKLKSNKRRIVLKIIGVIGLAVIASGIFIFSPRSKTFKEIGMSNVVVSTIKTEVVARPDGLALADDGTLYITEYGNPDLIKFIRRQPSGTTLYKLTPTGEKTIITDKLSNPVGMSITSTGNLIIGNRSSSELVSVSPDETVLRVIAKGKFSGGVVVDENDNIYVIESYKKDENGLLKITPEGTITEIARDSQIVIGQGMDIDSNGTVYVAQTYGTKIVSITQTGEVTVLADIPNALQQGVSFCDIVIVDDTIYVAGFGMEVIYAIKIDGSYSVIAGNSEHATIDGPGDTASFENPVRLVYNKNTNSLIVADYSGTLREVHLP